MLLNFIAYLLIPAYTIWFVQGSNWLTTNFSVLGSTVDGQNKFVLWGIIVGLYFFWCLHVITNRMPKKPRGTFFMPFAMLLLTIAITTPYLPKELPLGSFLHVIFAFLAADCLILYLYLMIWQLYRLEPKIYRYYLVILIWITLFSAFLLVVAGIVSSALEIFFTITTVILVRLLFSQVRSLSTSK